MSEDELSDTTEVITLPSGAVKYGDFVVEPWPSLRIRPYRSLTFADEIVRAVPGSRFWPFAQLIPDHIRQLARSAPAFRWAALELCAANEARGLDALQSCPALGVLIIASYEPDVDGEREAYFRRILARPWRKILPIVGLPTRPRTIRLLQKLPLEHCRWQTVAKMKILLRKRGHPWMHVMPHLKRVTRDTLSVMGASSSMITPELLLASQQSQWDEEPVYWTLTSIKSLLAELGRKEHWPYRGLSFDALKLVEGRLYEEIYGDETQLFPPPPIPGGACLCPLTSFSAIDRESQQQGNCSISYAGEIIAGNVYLYALLEPVRATVALRKDVSNGAWEIQEVRAANNADVSADAMAFVRSWFSHALSSSPTDN